MVWNWSFASEAGTLQTDGTFADTLGVFTFNILPVPSQNGFDVTTSAIGGDTGTGYSENQPTQGFQWNGAIATQFFRDSGGLTNGANFTVANACGVSSCRYGFSSDGTSQIGGAESFVFDDIIGTSPLTLRPQSVVPVPAPFALMAGTLVAVGLVSRKRARRSR